MSALTNYRRWRARSRIARELRAKSDHQLIDMGVPRWRIDEIARGAPIDPKLVR